MEKKLTTSERLDRVKPIEVYANPDRSWIWEVYRHYQKPKNEAKNPYARVFCRVLSPIVGYTRGEIGDVYIREIQKYATLIFNESEDGQTYQRREHIPPIPTGVYPQ